MIFALLAQVLLAVAIVVRWVFLFFVHSICESISLVAAALAFCTLYRAPQICGNDAGGSVWTRRFHWIVQGVLSVIDVLVVPPLLLVCLTWNSEPARNLFSGWRLDVPDFECQALVLIGYTVQEALAILSLIPLLLTWNHTKARAAIAGILTRTDDAEDLCKAIGRVLATSTQFFLYSLALVVLISWRGRVFIRLLKDSYAAEKFENSELFYAFDSVIAKQISKFLLLDLPHVPLVVLCIFSWRCSDFIKVVLHQETQADMYRAIRKYAGTVALEWCLLVCVALFTCCPWRIRSAYNAAHSETLWIRKVIAILIQCVYILVDIPCFLCGFVVLISGVRAPQIVELTWKQVMGKIPPNSWHIRTVHLFGWFVTDIVLFPAFALVVLSLWRFPTFRKHFNSTLKGSDVPENGSDVPGKGSGVPEKGSDVPEKGSDVPEKGSDVPELDIEDRLFLIAYRYSTFYSLKFLAADVIALSASFVCSLCPWRLCILLSSIFMHPASLALAYLSSALEDEKARETLYLLELNRLQDSISEAVFSRDPDLLARIKVELEEFKQQAHENIPVHYIASELRAQQFDEAVEARLVLLEDDKLLQDLNVCRSALHSVTLPEIPYTVLDEQESYVSLKRQMEEQQQALREWVGFWARYSLLLQPTPPQWGLRYFNATRTYKLVEYNVLQTLLDLNHLLCLLLVFATIYRVPDLVSSATLAPRRSFRTVCYKQAKEIFVDAFYMVKFFVTLGLLLHALPLINDTYEAMMVLHNRLILRVAIRRHFSETLAGISLFLRNVCSCKFFCIVLRSAFVAIVLPPTILYTMAADLNHILAKGTAFTFSVVCIILPFVFALYAIPHAIQDGSSSVTQLAQFFLSAFFAVHLGVIAIALTVFSQSPSFVSVTVPNALEDGTVLYIRPTIANLNAIVALLVDFMQLSTIVFVGADLHLQNQTYKALSAIANVFYVFDLHALEAFVSHSVLQESHARRLLAAQDPVYGQSFATVVFKAMLVVLWVLTVCLFVSLKERKYSMIDLRGQVKQVSDLPLVRQILNALSTTAFLTITLYLLSFLACDYHSSPPTLLLDDTIVCFQGKHKVVALFSLLGIAFYLPTSFLIGQYTLELDTRVQDVRWSRLSDLCTQTAKATIAAVLLFTGASRAGCIVVACICLILILLLCCHKRITTHGACSVREATAMRCAAFLMCFWSCVAVALSSKRAENSTFPAGLLVGGWAGTVGLTLLYILAERTRRAALLRGRSDPQLVSQFSSRLLALLRALPSSAFSSRWYSRIQMRERLLRRLNRCTSLVDALALFQRACSFLRCNAFDSRVFMLCPDRRCRELLHLIPEGATIPGLSKWWSVRLRMVTDSSLLHGVLEELIDSLDPTLHTIVQHQQEDQQLLAQLQQDEWVILDEFISTQVLAEVQRTDKHGIAAHEVAAARELLIRVPMPMRAAIEGWKWESELTLEASPMPPMALFQLLPGNVVAFRPAVLSANYLLGELTAGDNSTEVLRRPSFDQL